MEQREKFIPNRKYSIKTGWGDTWYDFLFLLCYVSAYPDYYITYAALICNNHLQQLKTIIGRSHLFCSSSLASSSSSSGLRFSESAGETAGADSTASWEEESGLSTGLPVDSGSGSMPGGEEGHSSWGTEPQDSSRSGLLLAIDIVPTMEGGDRWSWVGAVGRSSSSPSLAVTWLAD